MAPVKSATESDILARPPDNAVRFLSSFHRYGLPGVVIGVLFLFNAVFIYYGVKLGSAGIQAMSEMTSAVNGLTTIIREMR